LFNYNSKQSLFNYIRLSQWSPQISKNTAAEVHFTGQCASRCQSNEGYNIYCCYNATTGFPFIESD